VKRGGTYRTTRTRHTCLCFVKSGNVWASFTSFQEAHKNCLEAHTIMTVAQMERELEES
jgi:hypothetical protein